MDYFLVTHDYVIAAFLQQVLIWETENGQMKRGFDSLTELGDNSIEFLENLEIIAKTDDKGKLIVKTDDKGNKTIDAVFRDKKCSIDMDRLYELAKIGNDLKEAKSKS